MSATEGIRSLSLSSVVQASPQQLSCDVAHEAVLLSIHDGQYYGLNEVGASIWRLIQQPRTVREIRDQLITEYSDIDSGECERAVVAFLHEMGALALIEIS